MADSHHTLLIRFNAILQQFSSYGSSAFMVGIRLVIPYGSFSNRRRCVTAYGLKGKMMQMRCTSGSSNLAMEEKISF
jgi:hypothetical protein